MRRCFEVDYSAHGLVRDLRVRWALEEAHLPYEVRLLEQGDQDQDQDHADYRALQPFGQIPIFEAQGAVLFESGAIVLHVGERSDVLLPKEPSHAPGRFSGQKAGGKRLPGWRALHGWGPHDGDGPALSLGYFDARSATGCVS